MFEVYLFVFWFSGSKAGVEIEPMVDMTTCELVAAAYTEFSKSYVGVFGGSPKTKCVKIES